MPKTSTGLFRLGKGKGKFLPVFN